MTALVLAFLIFCAGVWYERCRVDRLAEIQRQRTATARFKAYLRAPQRIFVENRPYYSDCLEGPTYHVANVDALIALRSRATTGGV